LRAGVTCEHMDTIEDAIAKVAIYGIEKNGKSETTPDAVTAMVDVLCEEDEDGVHSNIRLRGIAPIRIILHFILTVLHDKLPKWLSIQYTGDVVH
jgi:hypothetical protein